MCLLAFVLFVCVPIWKFLGISLTKAYKVYQIDARFSKFSLNVQ